MILIRRWIVNVWTWIATGGDNYDLVELAEEENWIEKSENLKKEIGIMNEWEEEKGGGVVVTYLREEVGEVGGEIRPEERVGVECDDEEADVICNERKMG